MIVSSLADDVSTGVKAEFNTNDFVVWLTVADHSELGYDAGDAIAFTLT